MKKKESASWSKLGEKREGEVQLLDGGSGGLESKNSIFLFSHAWHNFPATRKVYPPLDVKKNSV